MRNLVFLTVRNREILEWVTARNFCKAIILGRSSTRADIAGQTASQRFSALVTLGVYLEVESEGLRNSTLIPFMVRGTGAGCRPLVPA